ncbi:MAG: Gfo/Idh/MocA family oxidoreductase [Ruminobacter sp.]|uniref:Gfo/Idh/MocA family protein n=1 Tax=Ruminobacter sp. TaxID=2774296 RepID=UPI00257FD23A|nr:Gfo/Idh/MocA family oxidoreductase [Ruminobacter sp.]MBQ3775020.1 Gfo/Idh/MocA family oxidoreductase [Ruminobacter sp.]
MADSVADSHGYGVAIIGAGAMSRERIKIYKALNRPITAIYSHHTDKAVALVEEFGLTGQTKVFDSISSFWEYEKSSYVYIATSNDSHCNYATEAMLHDRNVLVEQMMVCSISELAKIHECLKNSKKIIMEANPTLTSPLLNSFGEVIRGHESFEDIGRPTNVCISLGKSNPKFVRDDFLRYKINLSDGVLFNLGGYAIGAAVSLLGTHVEVVNSHLDISREYHVGVNAHIILRNRFGVSATITISNVSNLPCVLDIGGTNGFYFARDFIHAQSYNCCMNGDAPEARDLTSRFDKESGICRKTFENDSEYNFAMQILQFEKLQENGYDSCMAGNRNHFKESKAVFRIITEVMANNYSDV